MSRLPKLDGVPGTLRMGDWREQLPRQLSPGAERAGEGGLSHSVVARSFFFSLSSNTTVSQLILFPPPSIYSSSSFFVFIVYSITVPTFLPFPTTTPLISFFKMV